MLSTFTALPSRKHNVHKRVYNPQNFVLNLLNMLLGKTSRLSHAHRRFIPHPCVKSELAQ